MMTRREIFRTALGALGAPFAALIPVPPPVPEPHYWKQWYRYVDYPDPYTSPSLTESFLTTDAMGVPIWHFSNEPVPIPEGASWIVAKLDLDGRVRVGE